MCTSGLMQCVPGLLAQHKGGSISCKSCYKLLHYGTWDRGLWAKYLVGSHWSFFGKLLSFTEAKAESKHAAKYARSHITSKCSYIFGPWYLLRR